jgi:hypothetical protein
MLGPRARGQQNSLSVGHHPPLLLHVYLLCTIRTPSKGSQQGTDTGGHFDAAEQARRQPPPLLTVDLS